MRKLAGLLVVLAIGCRESPTAPDVIFRPLTSGVFSSVTSQSARAIFDAPTWAQLQTQIVPDTPPPAVNFSADVVLIVFAGDRPSSGYRVLIDRVILREQRFEVAAIEETPHPTCIVATVITRPFAAVAVTRSDRSVEALWTRRTGPPCT